MSQLLQIWLHAIYIMSSNLNNVRFVFHPCFHLISYGSCPLQLILVDEIYCKPELYHFLITNICTQIQDSSYQVRVRFARKLNTGLIKLKLPLQYLSIFSLAANDPVKERRIQCKAMLTNNITKRREFLKQHSAAMSKWNSEYLYLFSFFQACFILLIVLE